MIIYRPDATQPETLRTQIIHAIDCGIEWIQLPTASLNDTQANELAEVAIPLCRESGVVLILENSVETVNHLHNHGCHLMAGSMHPAFVRERLGPHAIIGLQISPDYDFESIRNVDIDYFTLGVESTLDDAAEVINRLSGMGINTPVVVTGEYTPDTLTSHPAKGIVRTKL